MFFFNSIVSKRLEKDNFVFERKIILRKWEVLFLKRFLGVLDFKMFKKKLDLF